MKSRAKDFLAVVICTAGITIGLFLFAKDFNKALEKNSETPIATITFKYRTAQRKFLDRMIWDRLQNNSPIYNGDIIRTAVLSEATIHFPDSSTVSLHENTLVQLYAKKPEETKSIFSFRRATKRKSAAPRTAVIQKTDSKQVYSEQTETIDTSVVESENNDSILVAVTQGNVTLSAQQDSSKFTVSTIDSETKVEINEKAITDVSVKDNNLRVQVIDGNAQLNLGKTKNDVKKGEVVRVSYEQEKKLPKLTVTSPFLESTVLAENNEPVEVSFLWKVQNSDANEKICIKVATDSGFENVADSVIIDGRNSEKVLLSEGRWFWHIYPLSAEKSGETGTVNIIYTQPPQLFEVDTSVEIVKTVSELGGEEAVDSKKAAETVQPVKTESSSSVRLSWTKEEYVQEYQVKIADNPEMKNAVVAAETPMPVAVVKVDSAGVWYWQVVSVYQNAQTLESEVASFEIEDMVLEVTTLDPEILEEVEAIETTEVETTEAEDNALDILDSENLETLEKAETPKAIQSITTNKATQIAKATQEKEVAEETIAEENFAFGGYIDNSKSNLVFEEEEVIKPAEKQVITVVETEKAVEEEDTEIEHGKVTEQSVEKKSETTVETVAPKTEPVKLEILVQKRGVASKATNGRTLKESDFSDKNSWRTWNDSSAGGKTRSSVQQVEIEYGKDLYTGIQLTGTVRASKVRQYGMSLYMSGLEIPFSMLDGKNIRFKVAGDGNEYSCRIGTSDTGNQYGCRFKTEKNTVIQFDIPFSAFKQQTGTFLEKLDPTQITGFSFAPVNAEPGEYAFTVFDVEAY